MTTTTLKPFVDRSTIKAILADLSGVRSEVLDDKRRGQEDLLDLIGCLQQGLEQTLIGKVVWMDASELDYDLDELKSAVRTYKRSSKLR